MLFIYIYVSKLEFLDSDLKPVMQNGKSCIRDYGHISTLPEIEILVTADVVDLNTSIPHQAGLSALQKALEKVKGVKGIRKLRKYFRHELWFHLGVHVE